MALFQIAGLFIFSALVALPSAVFAHGGKSRVEIELESPASISAGTQTVEFQLVDTKLREVIAENDLKISHEKILHVLFYDSALKEFRHVHPEFLGSVWKVEIDVQVNGSYFLWAQGELAADGEAFSAFTKIEVMGGAPAWPAPALKDIRTGSDRTSKVTLSAGRLRAGREAMLMVTLGRDDGSKLALAPYLGAFAHVIAVPEDGDALIHVHPMNGRKPNEGMLHANFPTPGKYRLWIQFLDDGIVKTVPLAVEVF